MESLRGRLQRRAVLRRALLADLVEAEAVRRFWFALAPDAKLQILRFDDSGLVQRLHDHMSGLCRAELWCRRNNMGALGEPDRLTGFVFECPAETDCMGRRLQPIAFTALPELAESQSLFEDLKLQLGSSFLEGRPVLRRSDWAMVVETAPKSWHELQCQALRLVELAVFQAKQDSISTAVVTEAPMGKIEGSCTSKPSEHKDSRARRKVKKAKRGSATTSGNGAQGLDHEVDTYGDLAEASIEHPGHTTENLGTGHGAEYHDGGELRESQARPSIWPVWRSSWLPNFLKDDLAEWRWVIFPHSAPEDDPSHSPRQQPTPAGLRAVVKNTFLDILQDADRRPVRKSCHF